MVEEVIRRLLQIPLIWKIVVGLFIAGVCWLVKAFFGEEVRSVINRLHPYRDPEYSENDRELRKDWIETGLIPVKIQLEDHQQDLSKEKSRFEMNSYPEIETISFKEAIFRDIDDDGHQLKKDIEEYNNRIQRYMEKRSEIRDNLSQYFRTNRDHEFKLAGGVMNNTAADACAEASLLGDNPKYSVGWLAADIDNLQLLIPAVRENSKFKEDFQNIEDMRENLLNESETLSREFSDLQETYMRRYDIRRSQLSTKE